MPDEIRGGVHSYQGYEFQIQATVWIALSLMLQRQACTALLVEPVSGEDAEATLPIRANEASATVEIPAPGKVTLEVQIKLHRTGHWTAAAFARLVSNQGRDRGARGPDARPRAVERLLGDPQRHYVLVTDAQVDAELQPFVVDQVGDVSRAAVMPPGIRASDPASITQRIGIVPQKTPEFLNLEVRDLLVRVAHVPRTKATECLQVLQEAVRKRLLCQAPSEWRVEEVRAIIQGFGGLPSAATPAIVPPQNYPTLRQHLATRHALLLTGPPGSGKTLIAEHLAHEFRLEDEPYELIELHDRDGIGQIQTYLRLPGRHLFFIHDPWGMYKPSENAQTWATELPKLVRAASAEKKFVITSRVGVKEEHLRASRSNPLLAAERTLTEADYTVEDRRAILFRALEKASPGRRDVAVRHQDRIVDQLRVPLALVSFADALMQHDDQTEPDIDALLKRSNVETIGEAVRAEIEHMGPDAVASAIVLWPLLMTQQAVTLEDAATALRRVRRGGYGGDADPEKLLNRLSETRRLTPRSAHAGWAAHPTVLQGFDLIMKREPALAEAVLTALFNGAVADNDFRAATLIVRKLRYRRAPIPVSAENALDRHLVRRLLAAEERDADIAFRDLRSYSTGRDAVSLMARSLAGSKRRGWVSWEPPTLSPEQIAMVRADPDARVCAQKFIRAILPHGVEPLYPANTLVGFLRQFGWDLSPDFLLALERALERQGARAGMLAEAALLGPAPDYDRILNAALLALDDVKRWWADFKEEYRQAEQAELDAAYASHVDEEPSERHYPPKKALESAVALRRKAEGYEWLMNHPRRVDLVPAWAAGIQAGTSPDELRALLSVCPLDSRTLVWQAIATFRCKNRASERHFSRVRTPDFWLIVHFRKIGLDYRPGVTYTYMYA